MVPHGKIEEEITKLFMPGEVEEPVCVITGVSDSVKGEKLLLFSVIEIDMKQLRKKMLAGGMPNLWIPKEIKLVKEIPMLASGKVDFQALRKKMLAGGMPNLWIPKEIKLVKEIPMLASGKVDFQALRSMG